MDTGDATRPNPDRTNEVPVKDLPAARRAAGDRDRAKQKPDDDELRIEDLPPRKTVTGG